MKFIVGLIWRMSTNAHEEIDPLHFFENSNIFRPHYRKMKGALQNLILLTMIVKYVMIIENGDISTEDPLEL